MQDLIKQNVSSILQEINKSQNILLHLHVKPDPDSIGSALAMYWALKKMGKNPTVIKGDSDLPESLCFLPGADQIVLKNYFEIDLKDFDLFIILDTATSKLISQEGEVVFPESLQTIIIDHHSANSGYAKINLVNPTSAATAEVLFYLFKEWNLEITKEMAACLYIGIYGDTGGFSQSNTSVETMKAISEIVEIYPDFPKLVSSLNQNHPKEKILFDGLALNSIETFLDDRVAMAVVSYSQMKEKGITKNDIGANVISNILISAKPWFIGILMTEAEPNEINVSFRGKGDYNVSQIAASLGGGGHIKAAGLHLKMPLSEAKQKVIEAVEKFYG